MELMRLIVRQMGSYEIRLHAGGKDTLPRLELSVGEGEYTFDLHERVEIDALFAHAATIRLLVSPSYVIGLDGTTYELSFEAGFKSSTFTWWGGAPKGWKPLREISDALEELAHAHHPPGYDNYGLRSP